MTADERDAAILAAMESAEGGHCITSVMPADRAIWAACAKKCAEACEQHDNMADATALKCATACREIGGTHDK